MSLAIPLDVTILSGRIARRVTKDIRDLSFRSVVPGGFASARMSLDRPLDVQPEDIAYYSRVMISDGRTGGVVWEGRLEDPARGVGSDGRIWELAAVGAAAHADDHKVPLAYASRDMQAWERTAATREAWRVGSDEAPDGSPAFLLEAPQGIAVSSENSARITTHRHNEAGVNLARVNWNMVGGSGSSLWHMEGYVWLGSSEQIRTATLTTTEQGLSARVVGTDWTHPRTRLELRLRVSSASSAISADRWAKFWNVRIRSTLFDRDGNEITSGAAYTSDSVLASEIVEDLLGRLLPDYDGPGAVIDTTSTAIDHLVFPDGATAREVLEALAGYEPDHYWAAWERTASDRSRFEYVPWPTTVAYQADVSDGYRSTGSATDLYDKVRVRWRGPNGRIMMTERTQTVPELEAAGLSRTGFVDAGDEIAGTLLGGQTLGDNFLAEHRIPRNAGALTIARPVVDHDIGRTVQPWEIRPGKLIRVRGVQPRVDALNPGGRDGVTVFRVVGVEFDAGSASATLELDSRPLTVTNTLGRLARLSRSGFLDRRRR